MSLNTQTLIRAATAQQTGVLVLALATFEHPVAGIRRIVNDVKPVVSQGDTFEPYPFTIAMMADKTDNQPVMTLMAANVSREVLLYARTAAASGVRAKLTLQIVAHSEPDLVGLQYTELQAVTWSYDVAQISCKLSLRNFQNEPFPAESFTPSLVPGVH